MNSGIRISALLATLLLSGCSMHQDEITPESSEAKPDKILNIKQKESGNDILLYVDSSLASPDAMDLLSVQESALTCSRVFEPLNTEEELARFGLDRWYIMTFDSDIESHAMSLSAIKGVLKVQYNNPVTRLDDGKSDSYSTQALTKAVSSSANPFNDPMLGSQWHYHNAENGKPLATSVAGADINVFDAWKLTAGDPSIIVAVVDEGVAYNHPDLAANMWKNTKEIPGNGIDDDGNGYVDDIYGYNFCVGTGEISWNKLGNSNSGSGDTGHGTHVAGTVAAVNNNGSGVCGIAGGTGKSDGVRIMSCQIYSGGENSSEYDLARAIRYAADNGACILQCSWGFSSGAMKNDASYRKSQPLVVQALEYFEQADRKKMGFDNPINGGIAVFAAGNDGKSMVSYPGGLTDIISVTAIASDCRPTGYTNYGDGCNIAAPGGEYSYTAYDTYTYDTEGCVLSTMPEGYRYSANYDGSGYGYMQGTSMACPHVSGVAALGLSYMKKTSKTCTPEEFKTMILTSVNDINSHCLGVKKTYMYDVGYIGSMSLSKYRGKMGTGLIDAWKLLMQIEGTPCIMAVVGQENVLSLESIFGSQYSTLTYNSITITDEDKRALGLNESPSITSGRLIISPRRSGNAKIEIKAVAGGNKIGSDSEMGGMEITKIVSVVARGVVSENGGWL